MILTAVVAVAVLTGNRGPGTAQAQSFQMPPQGDSFPAAFARILEDPEYAYLEYRDYPVPPKASAAKPPQGFKPVYVSHYGRHGARYNYIQSGYDNLEKLFREALADGVLTERGKELAQRYLAAYPAFHLRAGDLTRKGWNQHHGIGERMYRNYREVFRRKPVIDARASTSQRSIMSMVSFCDAMEECDPRLNISKETSEAWMHIMNPHHSQDPFAAIAVDKDKPYGDEWFRERAELFRKDVPAERYLPAFFTDLSWVRAHFGSASRLELEFYYLMISTACTEVPVDFTDLFTPEDLCGLWEWRNLLYYSLWGPGGHGRNPAYYISGYLLEDILDKAEEDLASGQIGARLRFGHDTSIGMILALMQVPGWCQGAEHPGDVKYIYDFSNVPMAANLQWIFYRNRKGETLVRMMLNERDLTLPLPGDLAPYYRWSDFLPYYRAIADQARTKRAELLAAYGEKGK